MIEVKTYGIWFRFSFLLCLYKFVLILVVISIYCEGVVNDEKL